MGQFLSIIKAVESRKCNIPLIINDVTFCPPCPSQYMIGKVGNRVGGFFFLKEDALVIPEDVEIIYLQVAEGIQICMFHFISNSRRALIIYSHGNAVDCGGMIKQCKDLIDRVDVDVVVYDYEGYGYSDGVPNKKSICRDIDEVYKWATKHYNPNRIFLYGESIGSVPTCYLAASISSQPPKKKTVSERGCSSRRSKQLKVFSLEQKHNSASEKAENPPNQKTYGGKGSSDNNSTTGQEDNTDSCSYGCMASNKSLEVVSTDSERKKSTKENRSMENMNCRKSSNFSIEKESRNSNAYSEPIEEDKQYSLRMNNIPESMKKKYKSHNSDSTAFLTTFQNESGNHTKLGGVILHSALLSGCGTFMKTKLLKPCDPFDNTQAASSIDCPVFHIHGTKDDIVPFSNGKQLYMLTHSKNEPWWVQDASHNNIVKGHAEEYYKRMNHFISSSLNHF